MNLGAEEYLTQPINNHELLARIRTLLRTRQIQNELVSANTQLRTLLAVIPAGNSSLNLSEVGALLIESIVRAAGMKAGAIWLIDQHELTILARSGLPEQHDLRGMLDTAVRSTMESVCRMRKVRAGSIQDVSQSPMRIDRFVSAVILPVVQREGLVGVVHLWSDEPYTSATDGIEFLHAIADAAATAIQNARLFEETDR